MAQLRQVAGFSLKIEEPAAENVQAWQGREIGQRLTEKLQLGFGGARALSLLVGSHWRGVGEVFRTRHTSASRT
jgi:hypothetical protein